MYIKKKNIFFYIDYILFLVYDLFIRLLVLLIKFIYISINIDICIVFILYEMNVCDYNNIIFKVYDIDDMLLILK